MVKLNEFNMSVHPCEVVSSVCFGSTHVPADVAYEIISWLDWKTVARCTLVCQSWRDFLLSYLKVLKEALPLALLDYIVHLENGFSPNSRQLGARWLLRQLSFLHCCTSKDVSYGKKSRRITRALCSPKQRVFARKVNTALLKNGGITIERIGPDRFLLLRHRKEMIGVHVKLPISCYRFDSEEGRMERLRTWNGTSSSAALYASHHNGQFIVFAERSTNNTGPPSVASLKWCSVVNGRVVQSHDTQAIHLNWFEQKQKCLCPSCGLLGIVENNRLARSLSVILSSPSHPPAKASLPLNDLPVIIRVCYASIQPVADIDCSQHRLTLCFETYARTIRSAGRSYYHICTFTLIAGGMPPNGELLSQFTVTGSRLSEHLSIDTPGNFQILDTGSDSLLCFTAKCNADWWLHHVNVSSLGLKHRVCLQDEKQVKVVAYGTFFTICQEECRGMQTYAILSTLTGAHLAVLPVDNYQQVFTMVNWEFLNGVCANEDTLYWPVFVPLHFLST